MSNHKVGGIRHWSTAALNRFGLPRVWELALHFELLELPPEPPEPVGKNRTNNWRTGGSAFRVRPTVNQGLEVVSNNLPVREPRNGRPPIYGTALEHPEGLRAVCLRS